MAHNESEVTYSYQEAGKFVLQNNSLVFMSHGGITIQAVGTIVSFTLNIGAGINPFTERYRLIKTGISII